MTVVKIRTYINFPNPYARGIIDDINWNKITSYCII